MLSKAQRAPNFEGRVWLGRITLARHYDQLPVCSLNLAICLVSYHAAMRSKGEGSQLNPRALYDDGIWGTARLGSCIWSALENE